MHILARRPLVKMKVVNEVLSKQDIIYHASTRHKSLLHWAHNLYHDWLKSIHQNTTYDFV